MIDDETKKNSSENVDKQTPVSILDESEKTKIDELVENEVLTNSLVLLLGIFMTLSIINIGQTLFTIIKMSNDKSIPVVVCPQTYNLDAPVVMNTLDRSGIVATDRWIRGFVRRFINSQFPRTGQDAKEKFQYVVNHSKGVVQYKYQEFVDEIKEIAKYIDGGVYYKFYPTDSKDMRISRMPDSPNQWVVEIDGYLVKRSSGKEDRFSPTLRYVIEAGEANLDNPEGLYVVDTSLEQITDYLSGAKKELISK